MIREDKLSVWVELGVDFELGLGLVEGLMT